MAYHQDSMLTPAARLTAEALPREVLAVLPQDPYDQLDLAHRITALAYTQKVANLEAEARGLNQQLTTKNSQIKSLERKVSMMEVEVGEHQEKCRQSLEEQAKLVAEKNSLIATVKKLNRDVARLEGFKRNLMQSLQDDEDVIREKDYGAPMANELGTDYAAERLVQSVLNASHNDTQSHGSGAASALGHHHDTPGYGSTPNMPPPPASAPASATPNAGIGSTTPARVDGKEFFRRARARLSYEQFSAFLQNIKDLNAHRKTREEALGRAKEIFGSEGADLYASFEGLLSRHLPL